MLCKCLFFPVTNFREKGMGIYLVFMQKLSTVSGGSPALENKSSNLRYRQIDSGFDFKLK